MISEQSLPENVAGRKGTSVSEPGMGRILGNAVLNSDNRLFEYLIFLISCSYSTTPKKPLTNKDRREAVLDHGLTNSLLQVRCAAA